jgi:hypothetical protein
MVNFFFFLIMATENVREAEGQNLQLAHSQPWVHSFFPYIYTLLSYIVCSRHYPRERC